MASKDRSTLGSENSRYSASRGKSSKDQQNTANIGGKDTAVKAAQSCLFLPLTPLNGSLQYDQLVLHTTAEAVAVEEVEAFFDTYDPHFTVERVNASTYNIFFDSVSVAKDALETYGVAAVPLDVSVADKLTEEEQRCLQWRECRGLGRHRCAAGMLYVRYAVDRDGRAGKSLPSSSSSRGSQQQHTAGARVRGRLDLPSKGSTQSDTDLRATLDRKRHEPPSDSLWNEPGDLRSELAVSKRKMQPREEKGAHVLSSAAVSSADSRSARSSNYSRRDHRDLREGLTKSRLAGPRALADGHTSHHRMKPSLQSRLGPRSSAS